MPQPLEYSDAWDVHREATTAQRDAEDALAIVSRDAALAEEAYGLCVCGCGERTNLHPQTDAARGVVKGRPRKFVAGHQGRGRKPWNRTSDVEYVIDDNGCWIWQLRLDAKGYALASVGSHPVRAARLYYKRHIGPIPDGEQIDHLCRVRACVNPEHLEPVTPAENIRRKPSTKLTSDLALEIVNSDEAGSEIARRLGISPQQVCNVRKGRCWADVTGLAA